MRLQLLLADRCPTCLATEAVWQRVSAEYGQTLQVLYSDRGDGARLARELDLQMFPALLADGRVCAVGAPSEGTARDALSRRLGADPAVGG